MNKLLVLHLPAGLSRNLTWSPSVTSCAPLRSVSPPTLLWFAKKFFVNQLFSISFVMSNTQHLSLFLMESWFMSLSRLQSVKECRSYMKSPWSKLSFRMQSLRKGLLWKHWSIFDMWLLANVCSPHIASVPWHSPAEKRRIALHAILWSLLCTMAAIRGKRIWALWHCDDHWMKEAQGSSPSCLWWCMLCLKPGSTWCYQLLYQWQEFRKQ